MKRAKFEKNLAPAPAENFDTDDLPTFDEIRPRLERNAKHIRRFERKHFLTFTVRGPFAVPFIGDPHMDSPGFDFRQFMADMDAIREIGEVLPTFPINMGDLLDNWPAGGKLGKKLADGHLDRREALGLARAFLNGEMGVECVAHLIGNHDHWPGVDYAVLLQQWAKAPVIDWGAIITFKMPRDDFVVGASHDYPGHSGHNSLHALMRRSREEGGCDLYVGAHRHMGGQGKVEDGHRGRTYHYMRVAGYKRADEYAWQKGFGQVKEGASGVAVVNPFSTSQDGICRTFYDLQDAADWARVIAKRAA